MGNYFPQLVLVILSENLAKESCIQPKSVDASVSTHQESSSSQSSNVSSNLVRTVSKAEDRKIRELFSLLYKAHEKSDIDEQNRLLAEMEKLSPNHEKVFEAKVMFLQDDESWDGAHDALKDCVSANPDSLFCPVS